MKKVFNEYHAENFLKKQFPIAKCTLIKKKEELKKLSLKFPCFLKIISDQALHKTDVKGVEKVNSKEELEKKFDELISRAKQHKLKIEGILLQEYVSGQELIIGLHKDPVFNHVIVFGLGGIFTELLKDVSIRKCPIKDNDAEDMLSEIKAKAVLQGARGTKINRSAVKNILVTLSQLPKKYPSIQELDLNPVIVNEKVAKIVDARIIFE